MRRISPRLLAALAIVSLAAAPRLYAAEPDCAAIGTATMKADGTIVLRLSAHGPGGIVGDGLLEYAPGNPKYKSIAGHVGPLKPGETVAVCPWPDDTPGNRK